MCSNEIYNKFNHVLSGCVTILDALYFVNKYIKLYPESSKILYSMVYGKQYDSVIDFRTFNKKLIQLNTYSFKEDVNKNITIYINQGLNKIQEISLLRISYIKPSYSPLINNVSLNKNNISKSCPHCKQTYINDNDVNYIICGYNSHGYDWKGCCNDWCFKCGKMLCKNFTTHKLFVETNKIHTFICCREHAQKTNHLYPDDYCQCININVQRNIL